MRIDGKAIAEDILQKLLLRVEKLQREQGILPQLAVIRVGDDPTTTSYVNQKIKTAARIGIKVTVYPYPETITEQELLHKLYELDKDKAIHGVIVQFPIAKQLNQETLIHAIDPKKDVDGFHPVSHFYVPLAEAVIAILQQIHFQKDPIEEIPFIQWLKTRTIVVIGKGQTGGQPVIDLLRKIKLDPLVVDSQTNNPNEIIQQGDIVVSCIGRPNIINQHNCKQDAILISVGMNRDEHGTIYGDYDPEKIKDLASFYTPIPGGVGPVNVAKLMENVVKAAEKTLQ